MVARWKLLAGLLTAACCLAALDLAAGAPGDQFHLSTDKLPAPNSTPPDDIDADYSGRPPGATPQVPKGFVISVFAARPELTHVRWLAVASNGDVFLAETGPGKITLLRDTKGAGKADLVTTFAQGFTLPHGMAFHAGSFYVADVRAIWRIPYHSGDVVAAGEPQRVTVAPDLRPEGQHYTREIAFDSQGRLFLAMGARSDVEDNDPPPDASIQLVAADGTMTTFASGIRNAAGVAFYPGTDELWATVNERDKLGGNLPPDYLAHVHQGDFFGWPYAYVGPHPDPIYGAKRPDLVAKTKTPEVLFEPHSAPLGLVFYKGSQFPAEYKGDAFVAFHGSGPYGKPDGYKVVRVKFTNGKPTGSYEDFITGLWSEGKPTRPGILAPLAWGSPAGLAVAKDGSLLIADDAGATVWRVAYTGK